MKYILFGAFLALSINAKAQICDCETEFLHIKKTIEQNFAGFPDKVAFMSKTTYDKAVGSLLMLTHNKFASDNCLLIINKYLGLFKSHHLGCSPNFDPLKVDTGFVGRRPLFDLKEDKLLELKKSRSWEGVYYFVHDSAYKIALVRDATPLHDFAGVIIESKLPTWKRGMVKLEGKFLNDSVLSGLLYMRSHRPKFESFWLHDKNNMISGDWRREGTFMDKEKPNFGASDDSPTVDAKSLNTNTFYLKIGSFDASYKPALDSILKANAVRLDSTPNLILDLRDNGGGSDYVWQPLIPYFYTKPLKNFGIDVLATDANISGWKKYLEIPELSIDEKNDIITKIGKMENAKGQWLHLFEDESDSSYKPKAFPKKIVIIINRWCGSSTEELLLAARQSSKVILVGENTIGNLDYSNVVQIPFSCLPYTLSYPTTRSRRLNSHQGIDNTGIAPKYHLDERTDWVKESLKILGK